MIAIGFKYCVKDLRVRAMRKIGIGCNNTTDAVKLWYSTRGIGEIKRFCYTANVKLLRNSLDKLINIPCIIVILARFPCPVYYATSKIILWYITI